MPMVAERETPEQTVALCRNLFSVIGVKHVSLNDIDIAHRVPTRRPSDHPNAVVCKFVRRLARDKIMVARKAVTWFYIRG